jgi:TolB-like protein
MVPPAAQAKAAPKQEVIAVLDLEAVDASKAQAAAMTDRLREELLRSGRFQLVNRDQMDAILDEQAFQQTGCTSSECAVQVGKILGVRKMVSGRVVKIDDRHWLLSGTVTDVETAQTVTSESVRFEGDYFALLGEGIAGLAAKLAQPAGPRDAVAGLPPEPKAEAPKSRAWLWWVLGGVLVAGVVAASSGGSKKSTTAKPGISGSSGSTSSSSSTSGGTCTSNCNTVGFSW